MAYLGSAVTLVTPSIEGTFNVFAYVTADNITAVTATNYFFDGAERGMGVGDWIFCVAAGLPFLMYVISESGFHCTAEVATLAATNGNALPTVPPAPGSGLLWNNGGFVCVA